MEWSDDILVGAENGLKNLYGKIENLEKNVFASGVKQSRQINLEWKEKFFTAINNDLNMPEAMGVLNEMLKSDLSAGDKLATVHDFDEVLGLELKSAIKEETKIPKEVQDLIDERKIAREEKNWAKSDELRDKIAELGFEVKDTSEGQQIKKND